MDKIQLPVTWSDPSLHSWFSHRTNPGNYLVPPTSRSAVLIKQKTADYLIRREEEDAFFVYNPYVLPFVLECGGVGKGTYGNLTFGFRFYMLSRGGGGKHLHRSVISLDYAAQVYAPFCRLFSCQCQIQFLCSACRYASEVMFACELAWFLQLRPNHIWYLSFSLKVRGFNKSFL